MKFFRHAQLAAFSWSMAALSLTFAQAHAEEPSYILTEGRAPKIASLPTGKLLAYGVGKRGNRNIVVLNASGTLVFTTPGDDPILSPSGKQIVFVREDKNLSDNGMEYNDDLWIADLDKKTPPRRLTSTRDHENSPSWNPDGKQIVFATLLRNQGGNGYGLIEIINADGSKRRRITKNDGARQPSWSPNGKSIAFVKKGLCLMDIQGHHRVRLTDDFSDGEPAWSPDGKFLAYSKGEDESVTSRDGRDGPISQSTDGIYVITLATKTKKRSQKRITDSKFDYQKPVWSADGKWILLESDKDGVPLPVPLYDEAVSRGPYNIYAMKRDGSSFRRVTLGKGNSQNASWR